MSDPAFYAMSDPAFYAMMAAYIVGSVSAWGFLCWRVKAWPFNDKVKP